MAANEEEAKKMVEEESPRKTSKRAEESDAEGNHVS